jgi:hypothetical protein
MTLWTLDLPRAKVKGHKTTNSAHTPTIVVMNGIKAPFVIFVVLRGILRRIVENSQPKVVRIVTLRVILVEQIASHHNSVSKLLV